MSSEASSSQQTNTSRAVFPPVSRLIRIASPSQRRFDPRREWKVQSLRSVTSKEPPSSDSEASHLALEAPPLRRPHVGADFLSASQLTAPSPELGGDDGGRLTKVGLTDVEMLTSLAGTRYLKARRRFIGPIG